MKGALAIFRFLLDAAQRGERAALVTITDVVGSSSRSPGTHMAVGESGAFLGSFSGGCVEAAVIGEAQRIIASGQTEAIRFGAGSPFIDVRLPCGGSIDLSFVPDPEIDAIRAAHMALTERRAVQLRMAPNGELNAEAATGVNSAWELGGFLARHRPDLRLVILGHGAETMALARLGRAHGIEVAIYSPDERIVTEAGDEGVEARLLRTTGRSALLQTDHETAAVFLFHDHEWETALMAQVLEQDAFYVGAMGSRQTHAARAMALAELGVRPDRIARVTGPIGLIPAARDPDTLALSVLAQIVGIRT